MCRNALVIQVNMQKIYCREFFSIGLGERTQLMVCMVFSYACERSKSCNRVEDRVVLLKSAQVGPADIPDTVKGTAATRMETNNLT